MVSEELDLPDIQEDLQQMYELLTMSARRCAYDLRHAADMIDYKGPDKEFHKLFSERASYWIGLFAPDGMKNYRHNLHMEIFQLECKVDKLKKILKENNIDCEEPWSW